MEKRRENSKEEKIEAPFPPTARAHPRPKAPERRSTVDVARATYHNRNHSSVRPSVAADGRRKL
jgi:hypothetical protein